MVRSSHHRLRAWTAAVGEAGSSLRTIDDAQLRFRADALRHRASAGEDLDDLLPEAFAVVREASDRLLGQRHYDVQVMGGIALHLGSIAEMGTGEGKTLVAALPSFLHALSGRGVHVVTANDYLASRDAEKIGRVLGLLGLTVGAVVSSVPRPERPPEYAADVTYATSTELGFDYLYDNLALVPAEEVQRDLHSALVDEIDSVLVDEARTPLVIAGTGDVDADAHLMLAELVREWRSGVDFDVEPAARWAWLLDPGVDKLHAALGVDNIYEREHSGTLQMVNNIVRAQRTFRRDRDYVVVDGRVELVDQNTGRVLEGRRLEEGLHQAIEAIEGVEVRPDTQTLASITLQSYFRLYDRLGGMTGTASQEAQEFGDVYLLRCVRIPPNRPSRRVDHPDLVFRTNAAKVDHVVEETLRRHRTGQPVLVGTASVRASEELSMALEDAGIPHRVLNAKRLAEEAEIVASAGRLGAVTVATDMAGRGTDVALGGSAEERAVRQLAQEGLRPGDDGYDTRWRELVGHHHEVSKAERQQVLDLGGLLVLGTERHRSRRVDDQLRGRCGRQGDPGETRFVVSLEDELVLEHELPRLRRLLAHRHPPAGPITDPTLAAVVAKAQRLAERADHEQRKQMLDYEDLLREQRAAIYRSRRRLLHQDDLGAWLDRVVARTVRRAARRALPHGHASPEDIAALDATMTDLYPHDLDIAHLVARHTHHRRLDRDALAEELVADAHAALKERRSWWGAGRLHSTCQLTALEALDRGWREHLAGLEMIRDGVQLRTYGQRDPLSEYRNEGHQLFRDLQRSVRRQVVRTALRR